MDMCFLPLGKSGCPECEDEGYYCDECTRKILEVMNTDAAQPKREPVDIGDGIKVDPLILAAILPDD